MNIKITFFSALLFGFVQFYAQDKPASPVASGGEYPLQRADSQHPCVTEEQYRILEAEVNENCKKLNIETDLKKRSAATSFAWPLQASPGFTGCGYYLISNYVDQDLSAGIEDFNCGNVTYDGHRGLDIASYPYSFYKMDHDQVEIIAAAAGTIIAKVDGHADKNCSMNNLTSNYIVIMHPDGSRALYLHMKTNSLTSKVIGQTVASGEFLGLVGSSGSSTGPHLHFEVWSNSNSNSIIDPYSGTCNLINSSTWWTAQKPHTEPAIMAVQVNTVLAQFPPCPATEIPNDLDCVPPATSAYFYIYLRNETVGLPKNLQILGPGNTVYTSWNDNSANNYIGSYWYWNFNSPSVPGTYTFEASYDGKTCSREFQVGCSTVDISTVKETQVNLSVVSTGQEILLNFDGLENMTTRVTLMNISGQKIWQDEFYQDSSPFTKRIKSADFENGVYFLSAETPQGQVVKKIFIQHD